MIVKGDLYLNKVGTGIVASIEPKKYIGWKSNIALLVIIYNTSSMIIKLNTEPHRKHE